MNTITNPIPSLQLKYGSALTQDAGPSSSSCSSVDLALSGAQADSFTLSEGWPRRQEIEKAFINMLNTLQRDFPDVQIYIGRSLEEPALKQVAAGLGEGQYLILSDGWLEQAIASPDASEQAKQAVTDILAQLSQNQDGVLAQGAFVDVSGVRRWSISSSSESEDEKSAVEALREQYESVIKQLQEMLERNKNAWKTGQKYSNSLGSSSSGSKFKLKTSSSSSSVTLTYARVASAGSKAQVKSAMSEARRSIASLRVTASTAETAKERNKARAAISSLQKLLLRGNRKIRRLNEEELVLLRKKRAANKKQSQQLRYELQKKRIARRMADRAILMEGHLDDVNNAFRFRKTQGEEWEEGRIYSPASSFASLTPAAAPCEGAETGAAQTDAAGASMTAAASFSTSDVVISDAVTVM